MKQLKQSATYKQRWQLLLDNWWNYRPIKHLNRKIGIDLGSNSVRLWDSLDDKFITQPACVAIDTRSGEVLAVGVDAQKMLGRTAANVQVTWPIKKGVVQDLDVARVLFRWLLGQLTKGVMLFRPQVLVSLPVTTGVSDRQVVLELMRSLGAKEVNTIDQPLAASFGAQVPITDASGCLLLHLESQTMEAVAISMGKIVASESCRQGGEQLGERIKAQVKQQFQLELGSVQLDKVMKNVVSLDAISKKELDVLGKDLSNPGQVKQVKLNSSHMRPLVEATMDKATDALRQVLARVSAEMSSDAVDKGILVTGSLAYMDGIERYMTDKLRLSVMVLDEPDKQVIWGTKHILTHWVDFRDLYST